MYPYIFLPYPLLKAGVQRLRGKLYEWSPEIAKMLPHVPLKRHVVNEISGTYTKHGAS